MLTISSLTFSFEHRRLFQDINLNVPPGTLVHLRGANGVGKSTFLSILAGLRAPECGSVSFENSSGTAPDLREVCAYLPAEANGLYLKMDATENLNFWQRLRGHTPDPALIGETLNHWGLGHALLRQNFPVSQFSTGMRRRLGLARLALTEAPCWLLDEPIYGLDDRGISLFRDSLKQHLKGGKLAVVVSHDTAAISTLNPVEFFLSAGTKEKPEP